jgi:hypothetical protein
LPRELREIIYEYAFSVETRPHWKARTGLLRTSTMIYNEAIPLLYRSQLFGINFRCEDDMFKCKSAEWSNAAFYHYLGLSSWCIRYISPNFFGLIQNLQICFTNKPDKYNLESRYDFKLRSENLQRDILQLCNNLRDSAQLQYLDIKIHFICEFEDIDKMASRNHVGILPKNM